MTSGPNEWSAYMVSFSSVSVLNCSIYGFSALMVQIKINKVSVL